MLPESESTNATSWDPYFRKSFLYIPFLYKWMALCLVSLVSTPAITTDVWVTGSLQGRACPPSQLSCCSHPDLSGQPVFGTFLGCFCHSMRLMTHAHISEVILGDKPCQWLPAHQRKTQVCLPHRSFFLWSWQGEEMQEGSRGEGEESLLIVLWARISSENSNLCLLITCCKAARPQGSLDSCSDSSKWPECTE